MEEKLQRREMELQASLGLVRLKRIQNRQYNSVNKGRKSNFQIMVLLEVYKLTGYPSTQTKMDISLFIDLSFSTIQIWFQNERRARKRKNKKMNIVQAEPDSECFEISVLTLFGIVQSVKINLI